MCNQDKPWFISSNKWSEEHDHLIGKSSLPEKENSIQFQYLYERLNIIDGKVSSLLSVNAIFLAISGILVMKLPSEIDNCYILLLKSSLVFWLLSVAICLRVSFLTWEYLNSTASNKQTYINTIIKVTVTRTWYYNFAVTLIILSVVLFSIVAFKYFWI